jgi:MoaA/NifB/PqqE/SkfB family radical SAM enzyme
VNIFKIINIAGKVLAYKLFNKSIPVSATLSVTDRCNSRCAYCGFSVRNTKELSLTEIKSVIDILCSLGVERLGLWGGEPLVREDIGDIVDYCKTKKLYTTMVTNGYLIKDKFNVIKKMDDVIISFDGLRECHDKNREAGAYDKVLQSMRTLYDNKIKFFTITVLTKNNINRKNIDYILELSKKYNFFTTFQILHHNEHLGAECGNLLPSHEEYVEVLKYIDSKRKENRNVASSGMYFKHLIRWENLHKVCKPAKNKKENCLAGKIYLNIDTDGYVYPCSVQIGQMQGVKCDSKNLLKELQKNKINCDDCVCGCYVEYNKLFDFNFSTVYQWFKNLI